MLLPKVRRLSELIEDGDVAPETMILSPWLPDRGIAMIAGYRGVGKTMFGLAMALAIGAGEEIIGFRAPIPLGVLYVDGEMALAQMKQRVEELVVGHPAMRAGLSNVTLYSHADQDRGIPNLIRNPTARRQIEALLLATDSRVLFLDNLSALCNSDAENDVESWTVMQDWLLNLRRAGFTTVFLHHAGKPVDGFIRQRGTSKREDILNTTILLCGKKGRKGAFTVVFDKHRGFEAENLLVEMRFDAEKCTFKRLRGEVSAKESVTRLDDAGLARELG